MIDFGCMWFLLKWSSMKIAFVLVLIIVESLVFNGVFDFHFRVVELSSKLTPEHAWLQKGGVSIVFFLKFRNFFLKFHLLSKAPLQLVNFLRNKWYFQASTSNHSYLILLFVQSSYFGLINFAFFSLNSASYHVYFFGTVNFSSGNFSSCFFGYFGRLP